jgi:hypothetical protein
LRSARTEGPDSHEPRRPIYQPARSHRPHWLVEEAASFLGLVPSTIRTLINKGDLACLRMGPNRGRIRITPSDARAYLDDCRVPAKARVDALQSVLARVPRPVFQPLDPDNAFDMAVARRRVKLQR